MDFEHLAFRIKETNDFLQQNVVKAVNMHLTLRNWLTGFYIVEFEQNGSDSADQNKRQLEKTFLRIIDLKNTAIRKRT